MRKLEMSWLNRRSSHGSWLAVGLAVGLCFSGVMAWAQPANDSFTNAAAIFGNSGTRIGSNVGATTETGEPTFGGFMGTTIWYRWVAPANGTFTFDTFGSLATLGSPLDTVLAVYTNTPVNNLTLIAFNDDANAFAGPSLVTFTARAGAVYQIQLGGFFGVVGSTVLNWRPLRPANDDFAAAQVIAGTSGTITGSTVGATKETGEPNHAGNFGGSSVWYRWTAPIGGKVTFDTLGTPFDTLLAVYTGTNVSGLALVAQDDNSGPLFTSRLTFNAVAGAVYSIAVDGFNAAQGSLTLSWAFSSSAGQFIWASDRLNGTTAQFRARDFQSQINRSGLEPNGALVTVTRVNGSTGRMLVDWAITGGTAVLGVNYVGPASGTLAFNDFQMSTNIDLVLLPSFSFTNFFGVTADFTLSNPRPDVANGEDPTLTPSLGAVTNAVLTIQDSTFGSVPVRFVRANYRATEGSLAQITIYRNTLNSGATLQTSPPNNLYNNGFSLQAGSDYATPTGGNADFPFPFTQGVPDGFIGLVTMTIPLPDDSEVEFNEDFEIYLVNTAPAIVDRATVTIMFDRPTGTSQGISANREQPAGAVDRTHNRDDYNLTSPPFNTTPGANGEVFGVAVQADQKTVVVGDFTAYNTIFRNRIARINTDGSLDTTFTPGVGANSRVTAVAIQNDQKIVVGGGFTSINGTVRGRVARLNSDGSVDASFNPGAGANDTVWSIGIYNDPNDAINFGRIVLGGEFTQVSSTNRNSVARLNADGSMDPTFNPGQGANGPVYSVAVQRDAKVVIGGNFTSVDGVPRNRVARLNADGSVDLGYDPGAGADDAVYAVAVDNTGNITRNSAGSDIEDRLQLDTYDSTGGTIVLTYNYSRGGVDFTDSINVYFGGALVRSIGPTQTSNGVPVQVTIPYGPGNSSVLEFVVNQGLSGFNPTFWAYTATVTPNVIVQKTLVGGAFTTLDLRSRSKVARLNPDGSLDTTFDPGTGFNDTVFAISPQSDSKPMMGGLFTSYNTTRRVGLARLLANGSLDTSFMDTAYNQFAGLINPLSVNPPNYLNALALETNGNLMIGGSFKRVGGGFARDDIRDRFNVARVIGGSTRGPGNIEFTQSGYTVDKNAGSLFVTLTRTNGSLGSVSATFSTGDFPPGPGAATASVNYTPLVRTPLWQSTHFTLGPFNTVMLSDAIQGPNNDTFGNPPVNNNTRFVSVTEDVSVNITDDFLVEGDKSLNLTMSQPRSTELLFLGGENIPLGTALGRASAKLTIVDNNFNHGTLGFSSPTFTVNENGVFATINVSRVNGSDGQVSVNYATSDGTAAGGVAAGPGVKYINKSGTLTFNSGVTNRTITVQIVNNTIAEPDETFFVTLSNVGGGAKLNPAVLPIKTTVVIIDDDFTAGKPTLGAAVFTVGEPDGFATIPVYRTGGNKGTISVDFATSDGSAISVGPFPRYVQTSVTLTWNDGDTTPRYVQIPLINDTVYQGTQSFNLALSNPRVVATGAAGLLGFIPTGTVTIIDDDSPGTLQFSSPVYFANENSGFAAVTVTRTGGTAGQVTVDYAVLTNSTAVNPTNYILLDGTLTLEDGQTSTNFVVQVIDNSTQVPGGTNLFINLALSNPSFGAVLGTVTNATLTIVDDETYNIPAGSVDTTFNTAAGADNFIYSLQLQSDQKLIIGGDFKVFNGLTRNRIARLDINGDLDLTFNPGKGANGSIRALGVQADRKILLGGLFSTYNNTNRNHIARLNLDGTLDLTFDPGGGPDNPVYALAIQPDNKTVIGGFFNSVSGTARNFYARLNTNGVVDPTFNTGLGANANVYAVALQPDGRVLIGGDFTTVDGVARARIARLNSNGSVDLTFTNYLTGVTGANESVRAITVQPDGRILIGGLFTSVDGAPRNYLARLNKDGTLDTSFDPGLGGNNVVYTIALQDDGKLAVAGDFTTFSGVTRNRITRLNADGSMDPSINFGVGANSFVAALAIYPTGAEINKMVIGGGFTAFNGTPRNYLARLHGGAIAGQGKIKFASASYSVREDGGQAVITLSRTGGTADAVSINYATSDGTALGYTSGSTTGFAYTNTTGTVVFPAGETIGSFQVGIINDLITEGDKTVNLTLSGPAGPPTAVPLQAVGLGDQPVATLTIIDDDSVINFSSPSYSVNKGVPSRQAIITVTRRSGLYKSVSVQYATSDLTALAGVNYVGVTNTLFFAPGESNKNFAVTIIDDNRIDGNQTLALRLFNTTGVNVSLGSQANAILTIVDNHFGPGILNFSAATYTVDEAAGTAAITITRTNGTTGVVSVKYATSDGSAVAGFNYTSVNGIMSFADGESSKTFTVPILLNAIQETNKTVNLTLSNPTGLSTLGGQSTAKLTIINNDILLYGNLVLSTNLYTIPKNGGAAVINVRRIGGTTGTISADFATRNGTAVSGKQYTGVTNTLVFAPGQTTTNVFISILNNSLVDGDKTVNLALSNPGGGTSLGVPSAAVLTIVDVNTAPGILGFSAPTYLVNENGTNAIITVTRTNGFTGSVSVNFATTNATALAGIDYVGVTNTLIFADGQTSTNILVPVFNDIIQQGNRSLKLRLSNATNITAGLADNSLLGLTNAVLTIVDDEPSAGSVDTGFSTGAGANDTVYGLALRQSDGKLLVAGDFTAFSGVTRSNVARLQVDGSLDTAFNAGSINLKKTNATLRAVAVYDSSVNTGKVMIGGLFDTIGGLARTNIARLNIDGTVDPTFDPGSGANGLILALAIQNDGRVVIAGAFTQVGGVSRNFIARLNIDGSLDTGFDPGNGANGRVRSLALDDSGGILIGGDFTVVDGVLRNHVARLRADGSVDKLFDPGTGASDFVSALAVKPDGKIVMGGAFTNVAGLVRNRIAQLKANGAVDTSFDPLMGPDDTVGAVAVQSDGMVIIAGGFTTVNNLSRNRLARLTATGAVDSSINFGSGANNFIAAAVVQTDGKIVIGGGFTLFNGAVANRVTRLNGGNNTGAGSFDFSLAAYSVVENGGFATLKVLRSGGTAGTVTVNYATSDGTAFAGIDYTNSNGTLTFPPGVTENTFTVGIIDNSIVDGNRTVALTLSNPSTGTSLGFTAAATLTILDNDGVIGFSTSAYGVNENAGSVVITVNRAGGATGPASVDFATSDGTALNGFDYRGTNGTLTFAANQTSATFAVPIINDTLIEGYESFNLTLANPTGAVVLGQSTATVTIADDEFNPGILIFSSTNYFVNEGATNAIITVLRVNGSSGTVSADFTTQDGTARAPNHYLTTNGTISFLDGETVKSFKVRVIDDQIVNDGEFLFLQLSNPTGGAALAGAGPFGVLDPTFNAAGAGPTNAVNAVALQPDGRVLIGGAFTNVSGVAHGRIARLNADGTLDVSFDPGTGANGVVNALALQPNGQVLVGGAFTSMGTNAISRIARLNANGTLDAAFAIGTGANGIVQSVLIQPDGRILIVGAFTLVNGTARNGIARLNFDGTLDAGFDPGTGANAAVNAVALQSNGQIMIGGAFTTFSTTNIALRVARLNQNGSYDTNFTANVGGTVNALAVQTNGLVVIGGSFLTVGPTNISRVARLNANGSLDTGFNPGTAADGDLSNILIQPDNKIVVAGAFTLFNGFSRNGLERLNPSGTRDTSFDPGAGASATINALALQPDTKLIIGGAFTNYNGTNINFIARLQPGVILGAPTATLTIQDNDVFLGFATNSYTVAENVPGGVLTISVIRTNLLYQTISADYFTTDGTAQAYLNYLPVSGTLTFAPGETNKTFDITILDDLFVTSNLTFTASLANGVGASLLGLTNTTVTIINTDASPDMAVSMTGSPPPVFVGSNLVYTISVTNNGPSITTGVTVTNVLPPSVTFVSAVSTKGTCANVSGTVFCDLGTVTNGTNIIITITVKPTVVGSITNVAGVVANEPDPLLANNTATVVTGVWVDRAYPVPAGAIITSESILPANGAIDPGETVTVSLSLTNIGNGNTVNLVATLLATNGVAAPSGAQSYGVLATNGPALARPFTFTASGTNGGTVLATLQLQDGVTNHGTVTFAFSLGAVRTLVSTNEILVPGLLTNGVTVGPASPYPSTLVVSNQLGIVNKITLTLSNIHHAYPSDINVLLVSPTGENAVVMSHAGTGVGVTNLTLTIDETSLYAMPESAGLTSGTYRSSAYVIRDRNPLNFTNGPAGPYGTNLAAVYGVNPNGTWALYVMDDAILDTGSIAGGWSMTMTTIVPANLTAGLAVGLSNAPNPVFVGSNLVYTVTVTNIGPDTATGVLLTNLLPGGVTLVSATSTNGSVTVAGGQITCAISSLAKNAVATLNITVVPNIAGSITNIARAFGNENDLSLANNTAVAITVVNPAVDLSIAAVGNPNPVALGNNVTYTLSVTNNGPSTAAAVTVVDTLPGSVTFVSATPSQGSALRSGNTVTVTLGSLASNATATVTIVATPSVIGTITNLATISTSVFDPNLTNNTALAVTTTVNPSADLSIAMVGTPNPVVVRSNLVYTLAVTNNGPSAATSVNVTNALPAGTTFLSVNSSQGTAASAGGIVSASLGPIGIGASATVTITVSAPTVAGSITNTASVTSGIPDPNVANNTAQAVTVVKNRSIDIVAASATLVAESINPPNGAVDPGETVTVNLALRNKGDVSTANLVATLQSVTGVTSLSVPQNYGVLSGGGASVARPFTFTASGTNGGVVAATLQLDDNGTNHGTVTFIFNLGKITSYTNSSVITINDNAPATPYPSSLTVAGLAGTVVNASVILSNLTHSFPDDIDILLVGPSGQSAVLMAHAGGGFVLNNVNLTLDDGATNSLPNNGQIVSGPYKPSSYPNSNPAITNLVFPAPAPAGSYGTNLAAFKGSNPNGTWSLYVMDDSQLDSGIISGGWSLQLTTVTTVNPSVELALGLIASTNTITATNNLTYTLAVTNNGPNTATGVTLTNLLPNTVTLVSVTASQGSVTTNGSTLTFALGTLLSTANANVSIVVAPTTTGSITNKAGVAAAEIELNAVNNIASVVVAVNAPSAASLGGSAVMAGKFSLTMTGEVGVTYVIQSSDDLTNWTTIVTHTMTSTLWNFQDSGTPGVKHRFYRAVRQ